MENTLTLLIKGMVCQRCIYVLGEELPKLGLKITEMRLGVVTAMQTADFDIEKQTIRAMLKKYGFDLLHSRKEQVIDRIKDVVEKGIQEQADTGVCIKFSVLISNALHKDYDALSALFSSSEGYTLEKYIISRKIEKVKELLVYTDQTLSDIAYSLGYSSPAHLSNQLKKHTGFTSSYYKEIRRDKKEIMRNQQQKE